MCQTFNISVRKNISDFLKVLEKKYYYSCIQFGRQILTCNQGPPLNVYDLMKGRQTLLNNLLNDPNTLCFS